MSTINEGDVVTIVGNVPENPVIVYTKSMNHLMNNHKAYIVDKVNLFTDKDGYINPVISVAGWNWDIRNIKKNLSEIVKKNKPKPVLFDVDLLDV